MPLTLPVDLLRMQPALRHSSEVFTASLQTMWVPGDDSHVVSLRVVEGCDQDELRSLVVLAGQGIDGAVLDLYRGVQAIHRLALRSADPFDDLT